MGGRVRGLRSLAGRGRGDAARRRTGGRRRRRRQPAHHVTPNEGLSDGQVVRVDGTGWPDPRFDFQPWGLVECAGTTFDVGDCGSPQAIPEPEKSNSGAFSVDYAVHRSSRSYDDTVTVTCGEAGECSVVAFMFVNNPSRPGQLEASAPITFASPK